APGRAAECGPKISCCVRVDFNRQRLQLLLQPGTRGDPRWGESYSLGAVLIGGECAQFLELRHGAFRIKEGVHSLGLIFTAFHLERNPLAFNIEFEQFKAPGSGRRSERNYLNYVPESEAGSRSHRSQSGG